MATALSMITRSMRLAGVIGKGESLDADEAADGLSALNTMLDSWQLERLFVYQIVQGSHTWASGASKTIGSSGDLNTTRPHRIESAFIVDSSSQWYPLKVLEDRSEYDSITIKTTTSTLPEYLYMDTAYPLATIYLYPVPSVSVTLKLNTWQTLQSFSGLTTALSLPPGYQRAIEYSLAEEFGPEFGVKIPAKVEQTAMRARANIKSINRPSMIARVDNGVASLGRLNGGGRYNIYSDS